MAAKQARMTARIKARIAVGLMNTAISPTLRLCQPFRWAHNHSIHKAGMPKMRKAACKLSAFAKLQAASAVFTLRLVAGRSTAASRGRGATGTATASATG